LDGVGKKTLDACWCAPTEFPEFVQLAERHKWLGKKTIASSFLERNLFPLSFCCDGHLYGQIKQIFTSPEKDLNYGALPLDINELRNNMIKHIPKIPKINPNTF